MSELPTPETDAEHAQFAMGGFTLDFCRKLERERDEAREEILRWKKLAGAYEALTPPVGKKRLLKIAYRDGWNCAYCGIQTVISGKDGPIATVEHVIPKCKGGADHISNCVLACHMCNNAKGGGGLV